MSTPRTGPEPGAVSDRVLNVPNVLSAIRLALVPLFLWLFVSGHEEAAVVVFFAGAWSDFLDGYIARRTGQITELGKFLDPLADRFFILAVAVVLLARDVLPAALAGVVVARDLIVVVAFPILEARGMPRIAVNFVGKCATAALLVGLTCLAYSETTWPGASDADSVGIAFTVVGAVLYWVAGGLYAREAIVRMRELKQKKADA